MSFVEMLSFVLELFVSFISITKQGIQNPIGYKTFFESGTYLKR